MTKKIMQDLNLGESYEFKILKSVSRKDRRLTNDPYFIEKDRKARETLKNAPIPEEFWPKKNK